MPSQASTELSNKSKLKPQITAEVLDGKWAKHGANFDLYWDQIDKKSKNQIMKSLSDWSQYYNGNETYGKWTQRDLKSWTKVLKLSKDLLSKAVAAAKAKPKTPVVNKPIKKVVIDEPIVIIGKVDKKPTFLKEWILGIVLGIMAIDHM